jgi:hypothetical protein
MTTTTQPRHGTVEYYYAALAIWDAQHDRYVVLVALLRLCIKEGNLEAARNAYEAFDRLAAEAVSGS